MTEAKQIAQDIATRQLAHEVAIVAHLVNALAEVCNKEPDRIITKLTGLLWSPEEAQMIRGRWAVTAKQVQPMDALNKYEL